MIDQEAIERVTKQMFSESASDNEPTDSPEPAQGGAGGEAVDFYQQKQESSYRASQKPKTHGSPKQLGMIVSKMVKSCTRDFREARSQFDSVSMTNPDEAENIKMSYMEQKYLPLVESLASEYGTDALINSERALDELDSLALTANGYGKGYTKAYLKAIRNEGTMGKGSSTDAEVSNKIAHIERMAGKDDIRGAVSLAKRTLSKINEGSLSASDEDVQFLNRVANYY